MSHRRRRRRREDGVEELGDLTDSDEEEESLSAKLVRLKREAEEVRSELERRKEDASTKREKDNVDSPQPELGDGVAELSRLLDDLSGISNGGPGQITAEARFSQQLAQPFQRAAPTQQTLSTSSPSAESKLPPATTPSPETLNAVSEISNRITSIEDALGLQSISTFSPVAILPALSSLSSQITALTSTLSPPLTSSITNSSTSTTASIHNPALDALSQRLRALTAESNNLVKSRTQAAKAASQLAEARANASSVSVNTSTPNLPYRSSTTADPTNDADDGDEYGSQIRAIHKLLPTIESLAPLLPVVLDRLRALRDVHAGAADVKGDLDTVAGAQTRLEREVERWTEVLEGVEGKCLEEEKGMKENLKIVGGWVKGLEERIGRLS